MRSPFPRPVTRPSRTSFPPLSASTVTRLSDAPSSSPDHQSGSSVLATRRRPSCSDIENWPSSHPSTTPLAR